MTDIKRLQEELQSMRRFYTERTEQCQKEPNNPFYCSEASRASMRCWELERTIEEVIKINRKNHSARKALKHNRYENNKV